MSRSAVDSSHRQGCRLRTNIDLPITYRFKIKSENTDKQFILFYTDIIMDFGRDIWTKIYVQIDLHFCL